MYCSNCGRKSEESIKFCVYCGELLDGEDGSGRREVAKPTAESVFTGRRNQAGRQPGRNPAPQDVGYRRARAGGFSEEARSAASGRRITFILAVALNALVISMGFTRWVGIRISFAGFNERYHLWEVVQLVNDIANLSGQSDLEIFALFLAVPLILWLAAMLFTLWGILVWVINQARRKAWKWYVGASILQMMSAMAFLATAYGMRFLINYGIAWELERKIGWRPDSVTVGEAIQVSIWPWLVLGLSIFLLIMFSASRDPAREESLDEAEPVLFAALPSMTADSLEDGRTMMLDPEDDRTIMLDMEGSGTEEGEYFRVVLQGRKPGSLIYACKVSGPVVIGRDPREADMAVEGDKSISRRHCRLFGEGAACFVEDLNSANHTYLNGEMLTAPMPLKEGDILKLGTVELVVAECSFVI